MVKKTIAILLILMSIVFICTPQIVFADGEDEDVMDINHAMKRADQFLEDGKKEQKISPEEINEVMNPMYNICLIIGIIVAVIIGAVLGIKFMTGSIEQKADVKKLLIPYVAGCVVVFGAFTIWKLAVEILDAI